MELQAFQWKTYHELGLKREIDKHVRVALESLLSLMSSRAFQSEYLMLKKATLRIVRRLKTARVSRLVYQTCRNISVCINAEIFEALKLVEPFVSENFDKKSGCIRLPSSDAITTVRNSLAKSAECLSAAISTTLYSFGECMPWLRLGHLANHIVTLTATLSRLNIQLKAMLVYTCDLQKGLGVMLHKMYDIQVEENLENLLGELTSEAVSKSLVMTDCDLSTDGSTHDDKPVDFGVVVSRDSFEPTLTKTEHKKKVKQQKKKKKMKALKKKTSK